MQCHLPLHSGKIEQMRKNNFQGTTTATAAENPAPFRILAKRYRWAIAWCGFHLCALFLSYGETPFFNSTGEPATEEFWPFVKFTYPYFLPNDNTTYIKFNGFFTEYDWTECCFYTGVVLLAILLSYVYKKSA
jgi:hypothetical protein